MNLTVTTTVLLSVLFPVKTWFAPDQPIEIRVDAPAEVTLVLTDFAGQSIHPKTPEAADIKTETTVDVRATFPAVSNPGTYLLYAVPKGAAMKDFIGTPLVIQVRADRRAGAAPGPMVVKVEPLVYARMTTEHGPMTIVFYFDDAPNTASSFLSLSQDGYYDGLTFHRVSPGFVIQGGDPRGDGSGGPGYRLHAEFNNRPHEEGVLSMARQGDPNEPAAMPRCEFANSAGSQFFICLDYSRTRQLDRRYTAFGRVVEGMDVVHAIAAVPLARGETPVNPPKIEKVEVFPVTASDNPYTKLTAAPTLRELLVE